MKYVFFFFGIVLLISCVFALYYSQDATIVKEDKFISFKDSNWVYHPDIGFITKDAKAILDKEEFTRRSREFFLNELKNK